MACRTFLEIQQRIKSKIDALFQVGIEMFYAKPSTLVLFLENVLIFRISPVYAVQVDNNFYPKPQMSFWAFISAKCSYVWQVVWAPFSVHLWQYVYNWTCVLIVQDAVDNYGAFVVGLLFLTSLILIRNTAFQVFIMASKYREKLVSGKPTADESANVLKRLSLSTSAFSHVKASIRSIVSVLKTYLRK